MLRHKMLDQLVAWKHKANGCEAAPDDVYRDILFDKLSLNEGMLVENAVAQQFRANGRRLFFFSRSNREDATRTMEIDFLIVREYDNAAMKPRSARSR